MIGFNGMTLTPDNPVWDDIQKGRIGGVILFSQNADKAHPEYVKNIKDAPQVKKLITDLQALAPTPLFVAIDQEGGKVSRLDEGFDVSRLSAGYLGEKDDETQTFNEADKTAHTLKQLGFNVNFAPCVDVALNPQSPIIEKQERSFSSDPKTVTRHARQVVLAHQKNGVLPVLKHFPGHGSAKGDTHTGFVDITDDFQADELIPYRLLIRQKLAAAVMTTHVFNKNIDPKFPLSLSHASITRELHKNLGFTGLVFSDDLQMRALADHFTLKDIVINALSAGTDVLVFGNNLQYQPDIAKQVQQIILTD